MAVIKETLALEDRFSAAFNKYVKLVEQSTASTKELQQATTQVSQSARLASTAYELAATKADAAAAAARAQAAQTAALAAQERLEAQRAREAARAQAEQAAAQDKTAAASSALTGRLKNLLGAYVGLQTVQKLVETSDQMTQINARLQLMTGSAEAAAAAQDKIYQAAQRSRGAYMDMADMVAQLGTLAPDAFTDTDELIAFAEQLQKQMAISGASGQSAQAAMLQLTQALASGTLRGDELNSVLEQTPMIAKTIADYMGVSTGQMREMASEGAITADVVKNAMLFAAEETNAAFEQMPLTWSQVLTMAGNMALQALQPVLNAIGLLANNLDVIAPIVISVAAALGTYVVAANAATVATNLMTAAQAAWNAVMALNPVAIAVMGVMLLVGALYAGVAAFNKLTGSSVSATGIIVGVLTTAGAVIGNLFIAVYNTALAVFGGIYNTVAAVANFVGNVFRDPLGAAAHLFADLADIALGTLQAVANVIDTVFGSNLADAVNGWRNKLNDFASSVSSNYVEFVPKLDVSKAQMDRISYGDAWDTGYNFGKNLNLFGGGLDGTGTADLSSLYNVPSFDEMAGALGDIGEDVKGIKKSVDLSNEDLKSLVDVATRRYVNNINLTSQTPVITINGQNTGRTKEDREALADALKLVLAEQWAAGATNAIAMPI